MIRLLLDAADPTPSTSWWGDLKQGMIDVAVEVIEKLPESPIVSALGEAGSSPVDSWMPYVNWFVPFRSIVGILATWSAAVGVYYLVQIILRWVKVIECHHSITFTHLKII